MINPPSTSLTTLAAAALLATATALAPSSHPGHSPRAALPHRLVRPRPWGPPIRGGHGNVMAEAGAAEEPGPTAAGDEALR